MDAFARKLLVSLVPIAVIASLFTGFVMTGTTQGQPPTCPLDEDFSGSWLPSGWTTDDWLQWPSQYAGGIIPEAFLPHWNTYGGHAYLLSKPVDTSDKSSLTLVFKSFIWVYSSGGYYCVVYTRAHEGDGWTDVTPWSNPISGNVGPGNYTVDISSDIGSATQVRFEFAGHNPSDFWFVDDVKICGPLAPPHNAKYLHAEGGWMNITDPIGTQWHELWPFFCKEYHLSSWEDNGDGVLSPSDQIDMYQKPDGEVRWYHVDEVTITLFLRPSVMVFVENGLDSPQSPLGGAHQPMYIELVGGYSASVLMNPVCTQWHEIYPVFWREYHLSAWTDNGSLKLDPCDYIILTDKQTGEETWWHVEEVAIDIVVTTKPPPVGGEAYPVSKASLLAPWIAVGLVLAGGIGWYALRRRRIQS